MSKAWQTETPTLPSWSIKVGQHHYFKNIQSLLSITIRTDRNKKTKHTPVDKKTTKNSCKTQHKQRHQKQRRKQRHFFAEVLGIWEIISKIETNTERSYVCFFQNGNATIITTQQQHLDGEEIKNLLAYTAIQITEQLFVFAVKNAFSDIFLSTGASETVHVQQPEVIAVVLHALTTTNNIFSTTRVPPRALLPALCPATNAHATNPSETVLVPAP